MPCPQPVMLYIISGELVRCCTKSTHPRKIHTLPVSRSFLCRTRCTISTLCYSLAELQPLCMQSLYVHIFKPYISSLVHCHTPACSYMSWACLQGVAAQIMVHQSNMKDSMVRSLQQEAGPDGSVEVTAVTTAEGLQQAAYEGARHIEITEHLDLTTVDPADQFSDVLTILSVRESTWSISVRPL
jgi:hypothetical protein